MQNELHYRQIEMLFQNRSTIALHKIIKPDNFLSAFILHSKECLSIWGFNLETLQPISDFHPEQIIPLQLNNVEIGELCTISNSFLNQNSLVYLTPSELIKSELIDYDQYNIYDVIDYFILIYEFTFFLRSQMQIYSPSNKFNKKQST